MSVWPDDAREELCRLLADNLKVPVDPSPYHSGQPGYPRVVVGIEERVYTPGLQQDLPEAQTFTIVCVGGQHTADGYTQQTALRDQVLQLLALSPIFHTIQTREATYQVDDLQRLPATEITIEGTP